jgi:hypothetical protein
LKNTTTDQRVTVTRLQDITIEKYYNRATCYCNTATTYTFISQKIKETQKRSDLFLFYKLKLVYSTSFNRVWKQSQAWEENFWLVDNIQNGILIGSQISMNNLWLMKVYVVVGFTVQYIDNINISYIVWI